MAGAIPTLGAVRYRLAIPALALTTAAAGACGFSDLFKEAGPGDVQFVTGDTLVSRNDTIPFRVELRIDGVPSATPIVLRQISDTTRFRFNATGDSIIGVRVGQGDVILWIESSLAPRVDSAIRIRVRP